MWKRLIFIAFVIKVKKWKKIYAFYVENDKYNTQQAKNKRKNKKWFLSLKSKLYLNMININFMHT
jgi:hypothetical protein